MRNVYYSLGTQEFICSIDPTTLSSSFTSFYLPRLSFDTETHDTDLHNNTITIFMSIIVYCDFFKQLFLLKKLEFAQQSSHLSIIYPHCGRARFGIYIVKDICILHTLIVFTNSRFSDFYTE